MTAPDPPAEAVKAVARVLSESAASPRVLAHFAVLAALPHLRAQWVAEIKPDIKELAEAVVEDTVTIAFRGGWDAHAEAVDAALRDEVAWWSWYGARPKSGGTYAWIAADYLRDTLTPEETP